MGYATTNSRASREEMEKVARHTGEVQEIAPGPTSSPREVQQQRLETRAVPFGSGPTDKQRGLLFKLADALAGNEREPKTYLDQEVYEMFGIESINELSITQTSDLIDAMKQDAIAAGSWKA
jgi:hypothetical protein